MNVGEGKFKWNNVHARTRLYLSFLVLFSNLVRSQVWYLHGFSSKARRSYREGNICLFPCKFVSTEAKFELCRIYKVLGALANKWKKKKTEFSCYKARDSVISFSESGPVSGEVVSPLVSHGEGRWFEAPPPRPSQQALMEPEKVTRRDADLITL